MGNPILGKEVGAAVKDGVVTVRYVGKYVDARSRAHTFTRVHTHRETYVVSFCVFVCEPSKQAQGLNFNYFLFGRYNISMLAGACPARLVSRCHLCQVMLL